jgi:hypothetical protein
MLPLLSLHALAAQRGDGLRPELLALLKRHAGLEAGLTVDIEAADLERPSTPCETIEPQTDLTRARPFSAT